MKLTVGVGLLGCGTVGAYVADRLERERDAIERRSGVRYELRGVAIRDPGKARPESVERALFTRDARAIVDDPHVDLVVELIGGTSDAAELVERALERGRHVVTANKDLLATQGPRLFALAVSRGSSLRFEGAVAGAIPVVRTLGEALAGDEIESICGVINGTCTSILAAIERGANFDEALSNAQRLGYAEADPSNDVEGTDAAHKLALIAQLAFDLAVISPRIPRTGIVGIEQRDVARARMLGLRLRLVAAVRRTFGGIGAEVGPVLIPEDHDFAATSGPENVVHVFARDAGRLTLRGAGAGGPATASAVLGDVVSVLRALGERRDPAAKGRVRALAPAFEVAPFFAAAGSIPELARYPLWSDPPLTSSPAQALANA
ncbi:MAG TPA: homoserine dehydrogenase [Candidatus Babeliales bacterium]|nr:homoserine dehydrogenase [Candidatus Babeliales bacterium]